MNQQPTTNNQQPLDNSNKDYCQDNCLKKQEKVNYYLEKIDKIPTVSFNKEQKQIAKKILQTTNYDDLDAVYGLITQRVKTGFVFDEAPEINHNAIALIKENDKLRIDADILDAIEHKLIIGENYDALKNLCATYIDRNGKGLIDVIYIDPPYNTEATKSGGNDYKTEIEATKFIYRDKFTRDGWLNMMNERLKLAKRLLSDTGVIFISIDDSEQAYLKVLCDEIFGEENFVINFVWRRTDNQSNIGNVAKVKEYILCYSKCVKNIVFNKIELSERAKREYRYTDSDGSFRRNILLDKVKGHHKYDVINPRGAVLNGPWMIKEEDFKELLKNNQIYWASGKNGQPYGKIHLKNQTGQISSDWLGIEVGSNQQASIALEKIFSRRVFDFPKPVSLIKHFIQIASSKSSIILDFFAGSGTTGQAVMELNEEDGGNRKFILVTNNENNIATDITRERLYRVIKGKGSKGEKIGWTYTNDKPYLSKNMVRVFNIEHSELTINDLEKAEELKEIAKIEFKKLNENYSVNNDFDIYNDLAALNPVKGAHRRFIRFQAPGGRKTKKRSPGPLKLFF